MNWREISLSGISLSEDVDLKETLQEDPLVLVGTVVMYDPERLISSGRTQYFYHNPGSHLPIRYVNGRQGSGQKTEPHIECGKGIIAENLVRDCCQPSIMSSVMKDERYLFLVTRPMGPVIDSTEKLIVGYIENRGFGVRFDGGIFVFGDGYLVRFEDAIPMSSLGLGHMRRGTVRINEKDASHLVAKLSNAENILQLSAAEVMELIEDKKRHCPEKDACFFRESCLSYGEN